MALKKLQARMMKGARQHRQDVEDRRIKTAVNSHEFGRFQAKILNLFNTRLKLDLNCRYLLSCPKAVKQSRFKCKEVLTQKAKIAKDAVMDIEDASRWLVR